MIEFLDILFQFRDDEVPLSDYVGFDARGTAYAEGRRVKCRCVEEGDGAVAPIMEGGIGVAGLGGGEFATVAAGGVCCKGYGAHGCCCDSECE